MSANESHSIFAESCVAFGLHNLTDSSQQAGALLFPFSREVRLLTQGHPPLVSRGARVPAQIYLTIKQMLLPGAIRGSSAESGGLGSALPCGSSKIHTASEVSEVSEKTCSLS